MKFASMFAAVGAIASVAALPANQPRQACTNPEKKVEWRQMDAGDQKAYLDAVLSLKTKPSKIGLNSTLYDDFGNVHYHLNKWIHGGPSFLPWHRYFSYVYLKTLRDECGYTGPGPYWDWTLDNTALLKSPVMSSDLGFGGDGSTNRTETSANGGVLKCVDSGPFAQLRPEWLQINPTTMLGGGHCLYRGMPEVSEPDAFAAMSKVISPEYIDEMQTTGNWSEYRYLLEGGPHGTIHASLGGEMNPTTSPNEPLFFLHHPQIDRLWWLWQQQNTSRLTEYYGEQIHFGEEGTREVSLDDVLPMWGLAENITIREIMDTTGRLCYTY
ncbi:hypothetical protein MCOR25_008061 [Pyricularia grisea]|uniref:Tyrosinase copper-binding domain-containing protein n=1 Tax=Pyricularia grisea TaxID=148305 RepID=A0A6P8B4K3_PYRGI|nr:hypothetical protein PgNI_05427 [Pyricularia grisea]KAI6355905.1 hypothetical protein MCOR25_008061 [Pyricularia grisea]TLD10193.1 hypothetical protein PgNI_05427 [Pyricularia grisea]